MKIKVLTWNINKASINRKNLWKYIKESNFDIGLFQEVYIIPFEIRKNYHTIRGEMNAILLKKDIFTNIEKESILLDNSRKDIIADFYVSCKTTLSKNDFTILSIYNYIGSTFNNFSEFLKVLYRYIRVNRNKIIIFGGDLNMNKSFQKRLEKWGSLAKEMKEELSKLGYIDAPYEILGENTFTFFAHKNNKPYQLDYLFIPEDVRVVDVKVTDKNEIINQKPRLSDHLPIFTTVEIFEK